MNKRYIRPAVIAAVLIVVVIVSGYFSVKNGGRSEETEPSQGADSEYNLVKGGYSFFPDDILPDGTDPSLYTLPETVCGLKFPYKIKDMPLTVARAAKYKGEFIEEPSGGEVESCLALIVHNDSDSLLTDCTLAFKVNNGEEAVFKISALPADKSCVVLESARRPFNTKDTLEYDRKNEKNSFKNISDEEKAADISEEVSVKCEKSGITLSNRGNEDYDKITLTYKNFRENIFFGGIAYTLEIDGLNAGEEKTVKPENCDTSSIKVIAVTS